MSEAESSLVSRGQIGWLKTNNSRSNRIAAALLICTLARFTTSLSLSLNKINNKQRDLNKTMFDNLYCHACMTVMIHLISYDGAIDGGEPAIHWAIRQPHCETDRRGKPHASRQA